MASDKPTVSIDMLFSGGCIDVLRLFIESGTLSPSQIVSITGMSRGKIYVCLNKLLGNGLVRKVGKGRYEITRDGRRLLNLLATHALGAKYVLDVAGGLSIDDYLDILRKYLGGSSIDKYLPVISEELQVTSAFSQEDIILKLFYFMYRDGLETVSEEFSKRLLFIKDFSRDVLVRDVHRKLVEYSFHTRILGLIIEGTLTFRELNKSTPKPYNVYGGVSSNDLDLKHVIYFTRESPTNLGHYHDIVLNVDWYSYGNSAYSIIRRHAGKMKYVLHDIPDDAVEDELTLNMVMNDSGKGVGVYIYKSLYNGVLVDEDGFGMPLDQLDGPTYNLSILVVDAGKTGGMAIDILSSKIFTRSMATYIDCLKRFYRVGEDSGVVVHIALKGLENDVDIGWYIDWLESLRDEMIEKNVFIYPYLYGDFMKIGGLLNNVYNSLGYVGYPSKKYRPLDVFDLKYLLRKALDMGFMFFNLVS